MSSAEAPDDATLVLAAQRGDREAFGALVARHAAAILGLTSRMLGPSSDAEDAAQETFVAAYRSIAGFHLDARFRTWLYRIAVNKCTDVLRARRPNLVSLDAADGDGERSWEPADDDTPDWELEQTELNGVLEEAISKLPPLYRESFVLRHVEGMDYDEMSAVLGVRRDTLKMRVYKARTQLCRALAHLQGAYR